MIVLAATAPPSFAGSTLGPSTLHPNAHSHLVDSVMSSSGANVYGLDTENDAVVVMERNAGTGLLTPIQTVLGSMSTVRRLTSSTDDASLYVAHSGGTAAFSIDAGTGMLSSSAGDATTLSYDVAVSPDGAHVYSATSSLSIFSRDAGTSALTFIGHAAMSSARTVAVSPDGKHVFAGSWRSLSPDRLTVFSRDPSTGLLTEVDEERQGVDGVDGLQRIEEVLVSPDGAHVYTVSFAGDEIGVFSRDAGTGELTFVQAVPTGPPAFSSPTALRIAGDGLNLYALNEDHDVLVFTRDAGTGMLTLTASLEPFGPGEDPRGILVGSDGTQVYVPTNRSRIAVMARTPGSSSLTVDAYSYAPALNEPVDIAASGDGAHIYVASERHDTVSVNARDTVTGALTFLEVHVDGVDGIDGLAGITAIALSPDDTSLYALGPDDDAIAAFARDPGTGALTFVEAQTGGDGVDGGTDLVVSPDGAYVYAVGRLGYEIDIFSRDAVTGALTYSGTALNDKSTAIAISPDGNQIYLAGGDQNTLSVRPRDAVTGAVGPALDPQFTDGVDGVNGLDDVQEVIVSPDGRFVHVASRGDDAVTTFARDSDTGALTPLRVVRDEFLGADQLRDVTAIAADPAGNLVVAADEGTTFFRPGGLFGGGGLVSGKEGRAAAVSPDGAFAYVAYDNLGAANTDPGGILIYPLEPSLCGAAPTPTCRDAARSRLSFLNRGEANVRNTLTLRWLRGEETPYSAIFDTFDDGYELCLYDDTGLVADATIPRPGLCTTTQDCWKRVGRSTAPTGWRFRHGFGYPDGAGNVLIKAGEDGKAKMTMRASGFGLRLPETPLVPPVTVQVVSPSGECWGDTYSAAEVRKNEAPVGSGPSRFSAAH